MTPSVLLQLFHQLYHFMDITIFNEIFTKQPNSTNSTSTPMKSGGTPAVTVPPSNFGNCSFERGLHLKLVTSELENWAAENLVKHAKALVSSVPAPVPPPSTPGKTPSSASGSSGSASASVSATIQILSGTKLIYTTQAASVMIIDKSAFTDKAVISEHFSQLSFAQLFGLLQNFQTSKLYPSPVSGSVMKQLDIWAKETQKKSVGQQTKDDITQVKLVLKLVMLPKW